MNDDGSLLCGRWAEAPPAGARRRLHPGPARQISVTTGKTKLSPLDYTRERLEMFPDATEIAENIALIEGNGQ
ncbi:hypothetical protein AB4Z09_21360 [Rhodococcus sp. TAF43]|uniref:hypothetical protein n=1 Tax=unclassified Rhodococcus (in: high G+C Gram-positive bacteria) TaxID=192944 RepID=UPI0015818F7F|nr:hypothetical protein [Rhodococcus sp. W8901]QKT09730.1 hypothetical protein HUN07_02405 [Rhodococcus sp. W8901]